ncbi:MAG: CDP-archaeol synthase [Actinobacteria bacterium]|nr:MAG: CDP-archaeol synthase [Actinomycetota bacterium]
MAGLRRRRPARCSGRVREPRAEIRRPGLSSFWSRIVVGAVLLPAVLGLVYLGGWWLWVLALLAALIALHELYRIARPLRPLVLAGYAGTALALLGAQLGGIPWMTAGFLSTIALAFVLKGVSDTRQSLAVAIATTVFGVAWIGLGLGHTVLLRSIPEHGRLAVFTVLLTVFAADAFAYFVGLMIGRHKMAPVLSPGKTWEGLAAGTIVAVLVPFFALYHQHFLTIGESLALGVVIAISAPLGDLFESALKRDMTVKDSGRLLGGHGGMLDRLDALLFASVASYYLVRAFGWA